MKKGAKFGLNILLLGLASLLNDLSSEMIMPILPMFLTSLGATGLIVGIVGGVRDSLSSILKVFCGYWSDKIGKRKVFVFSGYFTSSVFKLFLSLSRTWHAVLIFSGLERTGKGLRTAPRDVILSDSLPKKRGRGFGIHRAMDTTGAILGSLSVFFLFWYFGFSFKLIILISAVLSFFALIPIYFVKEKKHKPQKLTLRISLKSLPRSVKYFIFISTIFAFANFSYMFFILQAQKTFAGKMAIGAPILLYVLFNIFYAGFAIPFGSLSDKIGRKKVIASGFLLFSLTSLGFAFFHSLPILIFLFASYGIVYALIESNQRAYVSDLSPKTLRATALGTFHTSIGLASLPAGLIAGFFWQTNPIYTFTYGAVLGFLSFILLLRFNR